MGCVDKLSEKKIGNEDLSVSHGESQECGTCSAGPTITSRCTCMHNCFFDLDQQSRSLSAQSLGHRLAR